MPSTTTRPLRNIHLAALDFLRPRRHTGETLETIVSRLKVVVFVRVVAVTLLAVAVLLLEVREAHHLLAGNSEHFLYFITTSIYLLSLGYTLALRVLKTIAQQRINAYVQVSVDIIFVALLVCITNLTDSVFVFLFSVVIVSASILLPRPGAMVAATLTTIALLTIALIQLNLTEVQSFLELCGVRPEFLVRNAEAALLSSPTGVLYNLGLNTIAFFSIGLLATHLAGQLTRAQVVIQEKRDSLHQLQTLYRHVVESLPVALITTDHAGLITFVNPEGQSLISALEPNAPPLGRDLRDIFPGLSRILANKRVHCTEHTETTVQNTAGRRLHLRWTIAPLESDDEQVLGHVFIFQDITRFIQMEAESKRVDRLATIGQLAAGVAHEIRNPLASISGSIQLLRSTAELSTDERRLMDIVVRETDNLNVRITELLAYARPKEMTRLPCDLSEVILETAAVFKHDPRAASREVVVSEDWPEVTRAEVDEGGVRRVLWNLLCNAGEATHPGGKIALRLKNLLYEGVLHVVLEVEDNGSGISESDLGRVVEPFYTTKEGGTGLGLATAQRVVEDHGGFMQIKSAPERGARFSIGLPVKGESNGEDSRRR